MNEDILYPILRELNLKILNEEFLIDKSGVKVVEVIAPPQLYFNPLQKTFDFIAKKTNEEYCEKELRWYDSKDLSIDMVSDVKIWKDVASKTDRIINSNYGWCIYSTDNYDQYTNVLVELMNKRDSRRAIMIYTRPSMWVDWNFDGMNDFMCTNYHHFFIRENKLLSIYNIRSNDIIFGFFNDYYWAATVHQRLYEQLISVYPELEIGTILWQASSLHCYERHFSMLQKMIEAYNKRIFSQFENKDNNS